MVSQEHQKSNNDINNDSRTREIKLGSQKAYDWVHPEGVAAVRRIEPMQDSPEDRFISPSKLTRLMNSLAETMLDSTYGNRPPESIQGGAIVTHPDFPGRSEVFVPGRAANSYTHVIVTGNPQYGYEGAVDPTDAALAGSAIVGLDRNSSLTLLLRDADRDLTEFLEANFDAAVAEMFEVAVGTAQRWEEVDRASRRKRFGKFLTR